MSDDNPSNLRAGCVPFWVHDGAPFVALMVPSNESYGGRRPQIAKGRVKPGEDPMETGLREGGEELGLDLELAGTRLAPARGTITGQTATYPLHVWAVEVPGPGAFGATDRETKEVVKLPLSDAEQRIRENQVAVFASVTAAIRQHLGKEST